MLRTHPERWDTAIDEFMRAVGPARTMARKVAVAHERGGQSLEPGETVFLSIAAANHDPAVFEDPAEVDFGRSPNPHIGFGWGPHYCLGREPRAARGAHRAADVARAVPDASRERSRSRRSGARRWATRGGCCTFA